MEELLSSIAQGAAISEASAAEGREREQCKMKIILLEDPAWRVELLQSVEDAIPLPGTPGDIDLHREYHSTPTWEWKPFETAKAALIADVRSRAPQ